MNHSSSLSAYLSPRLSTLNDLALADMVEKMLQNLDWDQDRSDRVLGQSHRMIEKIRAQSGGNTEIETFLQHYSLTSPEGRALMTLAESLLRIPDASTADLLIAEKLAVSQWAMPTGDNFFMKVAGKGMGLAKTTLGLGRIGASLGKPVIRTAMRETVKRLGGQFVLGETIGAALKIGQKMAKEGGYRCSFDMLGEGARSAEDALRYFAAYQSALLSIGQVADLGKPLELRHGLSVKLSALHPRYHWAQTARCVPALVDRLLELAEMAAQYGVSLTVDAEESERLELSLDIISQVVAKQSNADWRGFGLAVQAYDRRCHEVIDFVAGLSRSSGQILQVRLVKGAYWDGEIKRAQMGGWSDYAVFQRKSQTDVSYLLAAQKLLRYRGTLYPMFATHNAHTAAAVLDMAGDDRSGFEFQRLHGMGAALGGILRQDEAVPVTVYAPVGPYEDLLPYLVRRMLENGANASFVAKIRDVSLPVDSVVFDPVDRVRQEEDMEPLALPLALFGDERKNSLSPDLSRRKTREEFFSSIPPDVPVFMPENRNIHDIMTRAGDAFPEWSGNSVTERSVCLRRAADLIEKHQPQFMALLQDEGQKTFADALAEIRETIDFCRYYAACAEKDFSPDGVVLRGYTGEENRLRFIGRGVFVCISPWNFPLAIFCGQVVAALVSGNVVVAKPAEQTPKVAAYLVDLLYQAGVPKSVLQLVIGDGDVGAELVAHPDVGGVAFTGSTHVAQHINRALANKNGAIVPFIAETGGQNAMIIDSTALLEQVVDDVVLSAFGSAGQRCSALRVVYVQRDIADKFLLLLRGSMAELQVGVPRDHMTDIPPMIDEQAQQNLLNHVSYLKNFATKIAETPMVDGLQGCFVAPQAYEIEQLSQLRGEVFAPVLHIIRYDAAQLDQVIDDIHETGFGLTFGIQSRLEKRCSSLPDRMLVGNIYINRSMIGAMVGVQPFGGMGLSGTGPKAGGPHYLHRFACEQSLSNNVMASGGNIDLLSCDLD